jgi:hypothetical protein
MTTAITKDLLLKKNYAAHLATTTMDSEEKLLMYSSAGR